MEFSYKIFRSENEILLAIADSHIIGKAFSDDEIGITVDKNFYCDKQCKREEILKLINSATIINAVGEKIISLLKEEKIVNKEMVLKIQGIPHAQIIVMK